MKIQQSMEDNFSKVAKSIENVNKRIDRMEEKVEKYAHQNEKGASNENWDSRFRQL